MSATRKERLQVLRLTATTHRYVGSRSPATATWHLTAWIEDDNEAEEIAQLTLVTGDVTAGNLWSDLDAQEADLEIIASAVLVPSTGEFREDLPIEALGSGLIIAKTARVVPEWRGFGLGPLLVAEAITLLGDGCDIAACHPAPLVAGAKTPATRTSAVAKLQQLWSTLGFEQIPDSEVFVLDLTLRTLGAARGRLLRHFGLDT